MEALSLEAGELSLQLTLRLTSNDMEGLTFICPFVHKASVAFGSLTGWLWNEHGISIVTKVMVYRAVIIATLLYGCETQTFYWRHIRQLDIFHMRCLCKIANIKLQDRLPNTEVLKKCETLGIEAVLVQSQLCWCGHVCRMRGCPKAVFYGQLRGGSRSAGGQKLYYKDTLKSNMKLCGVVNVSKSENIASDRTLWRAVCMESAAIFEDQQVDSLKRKRQKT